MWAVITHSVWALTWCQPRGCMLLELWPSQQKWVTGVSPGGDAFLIQLELSASWPIQIWTSCREHSHCPIPICSSVPFPATRDYRPWNHEPVNSSSFKLLLSEILSQQQEQLIYTSLNYQRFLRITAYILISSLQQTHSFTEHQKLVSKQALSSFLYATAAGCPRLGQFLSVASTLLHSSHLKAKQTTRKDRMRRPRVHYDLP